MNFKEFRSITAKNSDEYIDTVKKVKEAEYKADIERWSSVHESGWHRRNPEKVGSPADPDYNVLKGKGKPVKDSKPATTGKASKKPPGIYKPNKEGKFVKVDEAKVDTGKSADEKAKERNLRNTPPGADKDTILRLLLQGNQVSLWIRLDREFVKDSMLQGVVFLKPK